MSEKAGCALGDRDVFKRHVHKDFVRPSRWIVKHGLIEQGVAATLDSLTGFLGTSDYQSISRIVSAVSHLGSLDSHEEIDAAFEVLEAIRIDQRSKVAGIADRAARRFIVSGRLAEMHDPNDFDQHGGPAVLALAILVEIADSHLFRKIAMQRAVEEEGILLDDIIDRRARTKVALFESPDFQRLAEQVVSSSKALNVNARNGRQRKLTQAEILATPLGQGAAFLQEGN